jgi:hypothetical protein
MSNVLSFSCIHAPFDLDEAPDFLADVRRKYKCTKIVNLGDQIDFHRISTHTPEPDAMGAAEEAMQAVMRHKRYQKVFNGFDVRCVISNHDMRPFRRASDVGMPSDMIKPLSDMLDTPKKWLWAENWTIDNVLYEHGERFSQDTKAAVPKALQSVAFGHWHTSAGVYYQATPNVLVFAMSVGCLVDHSAYAFRYAKNTAKKPLLGCSVVIDGRHAIWIPLYKADKVKYIK